MSIISNKAILDSRPFAQGVDRMEGKVKGFSKSIGGLKSNIAAAFSTGVVASFANAAINAADEIDNISKQLGLSIETTQSLKVAFKEAGLGVEGLTTVMSTLQQKQADAVNGTESAIKAFQAFGISMDQVKDASPEQLLELVSSRLGDVEGNAQAADAMFELMGARSLKLKNALQEASKDGFGALNERMKAAGQIMEEDVIQRLDKLEERFTRQKKRIETESATMLSKGVSAVEEFAAIVGSVSAGGSIAEGLQSARSQYGDAGEVGALEAERDAERLKRNLLRSSLAVATFGASAFLGGKEGKAEQKLNEQITEMKKTNALLQEAVAKENKAVL